MYYLILAVIMYIAVDYYKFSKSDYGYEADCGYIKMRLDKGLYGEYLSF